MSFWPFGPHGARKSNIDRILNDYLKVLKRVESGMGRRSMPGLEASVSSSVENNIDEEDRISPLLRINHSQVGKNGFDTLEPMIQEEEPLEDTKEITDEIDDYSYDLSKISSLKIDDIMSKTHISPQHDSSNNHNNVNTTNNVLTVQSSNDRKLDAVVSNSRSSISSLLFFTSNDSNVKVEKDVNATNWNMSDLNCSFIDRILGDNGLTEELSLPNNRLIDFLCLGYFYDEQTCTRVYHIDYLIDTLLSCLDDINDSTVLSPQLRDDYFTMDENDGADNININHNNPLAPSLSNKDDVSAGSESLLLATWISDILSQENIWLITELLVKDKDRMVKLWSIINHKRCRNERSPQLSLFLKIHESLLISRPNDYLNFIRSSHISLVDDILRHNNIPILFDFLLKLISTDKPESPTGIIDTVYDQNLISKCLKYFNNTKFSASIQTCITDFLKMLVEISSNIPMDDLNIGPNKLSRQLCSNTVVENLVTIMLQERGNALCNIVTIVIELIRKNNSDYDKLYSDKLFLDTTRVVSNHDPLYLGYLLRAFSLRLNELVDILRVELINTEKRSVQIRSNSEYTQVGMVNLRILELIAELIHCSNMSSLNLHVSKDFSLKINQERSQIIQSLLDSQNEDTTLRLIPTEKTVIQINSKNNRQGRTLNVVNFEETDRPYCIEGVTSEQNENLRANAMVGNFFKIELFDQHILPSLVYMTLECPWNNMFHNVIFDIIQQIFNGRVDSMSYNVFLMYSLLVPQGAQLFTPVFSRPNNLRLTSKHMSITEVIIEGYKKNYSYYEQNNTVLGYMGHLVIITEEVLKFSQTHRIANISAEMAQVLGTRAWQYVIDVLLSDTRMMYGQILGGGSYVDDGQGNLIPQIPMSTGRTDDPEKETNIENSDSDGRTDSNTISNDTTDSYEEQHRLLRDMMTEEYLHEKAMYLFTVSSNE